MADSNPALFVQLLLRHQDDLLHHILPLVGSFEDAQDVLQETATALWRKFEQYDTAQPFMPWAKKFARYEVLMHHRKPHRYTFLTEELIDTLIAQQADYEAEAERRRRALWSCVEKLSESDRLLLDGRYGVGHATVQQLAAQSGEPASVLYKALARIRRQLLECISGKLALAEGI